MLRRTRHFFALIRIGYVLSKYDALFFLRGSKAAPLGWLLWILAPFKHRNGNKGQRLSRALQQLGPTFIKLGQALSTRADLVGDEVASGLTNLQDRLPPFAFAQVKKVLETAGGQPLNTLFAEFDKTPVAAASIAQVHFATLNTGEQVAVKIVRPNVGKRFLREVDMLMTLAKLVDRFGGVSAKRLKPVEVIERFRTVVMVELDLRMEAAAADQMAENMAGDDNVKIPTIHWEHSSKNVLVMERLSGISIHDVDALNAAGHNMDDIMQKCAQTSFNQVFRDGYFHADMHPGNIFVGADGRLNIIDFGIVGRLDEGTRVYLAKMLNGFLNGDYQMVADMHFEMGFVSADKDPDLFAQACRSIIKPIFNKKQNEISAADMLEQMFQMFHDFEMEVQPNLILLQKTLFLAEGIARRLNPEANFWEISKPLMERWVLTHMGPAAVLRRTCNELQALPARMEVLGQTIDRLPELVTENGLKLHPDTIEQLLMRQAKHNRIKTWKMLSLSVMVALLVMAGVILMQQ